MIALDTNILVHAHRKEASLHEPARQTVKDLAESMSPWCICFHSLIEFYGIATHPKNLAQSLQPGRGLSTNPRVARGSQLAYTRRLRHSAGITGIDHNYGKDTRAPDS